MFDEQNEKELHDFEAWFKTCSYKIIPKEEDVPPKHYKKYLDFAFLGINHSQLLFRRMI